MHRKLKLGKRDEPSDNGRGFVRETSRAARLNSDMLQLSFLPLVATIAIYDDNNKNNKTFTSSLGINSTHNAKS